MKKILLTFTLIFMLLASPATANTAYMLIVDGNVLNKPAVIINNTAYVPIRAVADTFNATTDYDGANNTISITTKEITRPPINGDAEFTSKINAALDLLKEKDFPHYVLVCQNTGSINQAKQRPPEATDNGVAISYSTGETYILPLLMANPDQYTPVFLAGMLTHEACHQTNWKYNSEGYPQSEAYAHQLTVYNLLNAPQWMKDWSTR